jgi:hypothetical protein
LIVRSVFAPEEIEKIRHLSLRLIEAKLDPGNAEIVCPPPMTARFNRDLMTHPVLRHLILDDRIIYIAQTLLGGAPLYFGMTKLVWWYEPFSLPFHKDNIDSFLGLATGPDESNDYSLLRIGIYLQDHKQNGGALWFLPRYAGHRFRKIRPVPFDAAVGDVAVWSMRAQHGVSAFSPSALHGRKIPECLEWLLLKAWRNFSHADKRRLRSPRGFIHIVFGLPDHHTERFIDHVFKLEQLQWVRDQWTRSK